MVKKNKPRKRDPKAYAERFGWDVGDVVWVKKGGEEIKQESGTEEES